MNTIKSASASAYFVFELAYGGTRSFDIWQMDNQDRALSMNELFILQCTYLPHLPKRHVCIYILGTRITMNTTPHTLAILRLDLNNRIIHLPPCRLILLIFHAPSLVPTHARSGSAKEKGESYSLAILV